MAASDFQPELTAKEFTSKMKSRFVLRGPRPPDEPMEGGNTDNDTSNVDNNTEEDNTPIEKTTGTLLNIVS